MKNPLCIFFYLQSLYPETPPKVFTSKFPFNEQNTFYNVLYRKQRFSIQRSDQIMLVKYREQIDNNRKFPYHFTEKSLVNLFINVWDNIVFSFFLFSPLSRCEVGCERDCQVGPWSAWGICTPVDCTAPPPAAYPGTYVHLYIMAQVHDPQQTLPRKTLTI